MKKFKICIFLVFIIFSLVGCSKEKSIDDTQEQEKVVKTKIGNDTFGYYSIEGDFKEVKDDRADLIYSDELGTFFTFKKYEYSLDDNFINSFVDDDATLYTFSDLGYPFLDGYLIRKEKTIDDLSYCLDTYLIKNETNTSFTYLAIEGYDFIFDVKGQLNTDFAMLLNIYNK